MAEAIISFRANEFDRDGLVSVRQVVEKTGLSKTKIYDEIAAGRLTAYSLVGKYVLRPAEVERWVKINQIRVIGVPKNAGMHRIQRTAS